MACPYNGRRRLIFGGAPFFGAEESPQFPLRVGQALPLQLGARQQGSRSCRLALPHTTGAGYVRQLRFHNRSPANSARMATDE